MTDSIADRAVALSLMPEALKLLDGPEHAKAAAHLHHAINELSPKAPGAAPISRHQGPGRVVICGVVVNLTVRSAQMFVPSVNS